MGIDAVVVASVADEHELTPAGQRVEKCMVDQVHALLLIQPAYVGNDGAESLTQPEAVS